LRFLKLRAGELYGICEPEAQAREFRRFAQGSPSLALRAHLVTYTGSKAQLQNLRFGLARAKVGHVLNSFSQELEFKIKIRNARKQEKAHSHFPAFLRSLLFLPS
jgi:hypothetical protein